LFHHERELRSAPKFLSVHRQQQCFSQISPFDLSRETSAFSSLIIALKFASPSVEAVALPNQSVDFATELFSTFCQESNHALISIVTGSIFHPKNRHRAAV
jgi:hypothetical protein